MRAEQKLAATPAIAVAFGDFRDVDEFRLPHEIRFTDGAGLLMTDRLQRSNTVSSMENSVGKAAH